MNKNISESQINTVLQIIYTTNISAANFDAVKKFFQDLPEVKVEKPEKGVPFKIEDIDKK